MWGKSWLGARAPSLPIPATHLCVGPRRWVFRSRTAEEAGAGIQGRLLLLRFQTTAAAQLSHGEAARSRKARPRVPQGPLAELGAFFHDAPHPPSWCVLSPPLGVSLRRPGPARPSGQSGSSLTFPSCLPQPGQEGLPGEGAGERRKDPGLGCVHSGRQGRLPSSSLSKVKQPRPTCSQTGLPWAPLGKVLGTGRQADGGTGAGFPSPLPSTGAHSLAPALAPALAPRPSPPLSAVSSSGH